MITNLGGLAALGTVRDTLLEERVSSVQQACDKRVSHPSLNARGRDGFRRSTAGPVGGTSCPVLALERARPAGRPERANDLAHDTRQRTTHYHSCPSPDTRQGITFRPPATFLGGENHGRLLGTSPALGEARNPGELVNVRRQKGLSCGAVIG